MTDKTTPTYGRKSWQFWAMLPLLIVIAAGLGVGDLLKKVFPDD